MGFIIYWQIYSCVLWLFCYWIYSTRIIKQNKKTFRIVALFNELQFYKKSLLELLKISNLTKVFCKTKRYGTLLVHEYLEELFQLLFTCVGSGYCIICCHLIVRHILKRFTKETQKTRKTWISPLLMIIFLPSDIGQYFSLFFITVVVVAFISIFAL